MASNRNTRKQQSSYAEAEGSDGSPHDGDQAKSAPSKRAHEIDGDYNPCVGKKQRRAQQSIQKEHKIPNFSTEEIDTIFDDADKARQLSIVDSVVEAMKEKLQGDYANLGAPRNLVSRAGLAGKRSKPTQHNDGRLQVELERLQGKCAHLERVNNDLMVKNDQLSHKSNHINIEVLRSGFRDLQDGVSDWSVNACQNEESSRAVLAMNKMTSHYKESFTAVSPLRYKDLHKDPIATCKALISRTLTDILNLQGFHLSGKFSLLITLFKGFNPVLKAQDDRVFNQAVYRKFIEWKASSFDLLKSTGFNHIELLEPAAVQATDDLFDRLNFFVRLNNSQALKDDLKRLIWQAFDLALKIHEHEGYVRPVLHTPQSADQGFDPDVMRVSDEDVRDVTSTTRVLVATTFPGLERFDERKKEFCVLEKATVKLIVSRGTARSTGRKRTAHAKTKAAGSVEGSQIGRSLTPAAEGSSSHDSNQVSTKSHTDAIPMVVDKDTIADAKAIESVRGSQIESYRARSGSASATEGSSTHNSNRVSPDTHAESTHIIVEEGTGSGAKAAESVENPQVRSVSNPAADGSSSRESNRIAADSHDESTAAIVVEDGSGGANAKIGEESDGRAEIVSGTGGTPMQIMNDVLRLGQETGQREADQGGDANEDMDTDDPPLQSTSNEVVEL